MSYSYEVLGGGMTTIGESPAEVTPATAAAGTGAGGAPGENNEQASAAQSQYNDYYYQQSQAQQNSQGHIFQTYHHPQEHTPMRSITSPQNSFHYRQPSQDSAVDSPVPNGNSSDELYTATYSGIAVFEIMANGVAVMRRRHDSCLNATQILKVAGVEKSKRTKVLEKEILTGEHEKVQGGYGKYQGTWIPFDRGVALCKQYGVFELLHPLLQFDPTNQMLNTPTKEQALASKRKRTAPGSTNRLTTNTFSHPIQVGSSLGPIGHSANAALSALGGRPPQPMLNMRQDTITDAHDDDMPPTKRQRLAAAAATSSGTNNNELDQIDDSSLPDISIPLEPIDTTYVDMNTAHLITRLFVTSRDQEESEDPVALLQSMPEINQETVDIPIDDSGHTALHWASALAMAPLVKELVRRGANQQRGNFAGETTLVRAVLVTNSFDVAIFPQLLESLYPAIPLIDKHGRTVLHHIALTAGIKGRSGASKYYLETLLEWIVKRGSLGKTKRYSLDRFIYEVVNAQDKNGDTALNIAARVGNKNISQQLLDVGASPHVANRAGLKPVDFGIVLDASQTSGNLPVAPAPAPDAADTAAKDNKETDTMMVAQRSETLQVMHKMLNDLDEEFSLELTTKQQQIDQMHSQLRQVTANLSTKRQRLEDLKGMSNKLVEHQRSASNLDRAISDEDERFTRESGGNFDGDFDADEPFRVVDTQAPPHALVLRARMEAYKQNADKLRELGDELTLRSSALEQKFKKVVSLCTGVDEDRVDTLLEGLVQAVQSDRDEDMDMERVAGFLRRIDRVHEGGIVV